MRTYKLKARKAANEQRLLTNFLPALKAQAHSRSRNGGNYHIKHNNCQHFIWDLQSRITTSMEPLEATTQTITRAAAQSVVICHSDKPQTSAPPSRHDSFTSLPEKMPMIREMLTIRDSTFAPLVAAAMEMYASQGTKKGACTVNVVTTEIAMQA